jgi:hypothetical protein
LIGQLNTLAPQIDASMVVEGRIQQLLKGGAAKLTRIIMAFRGELDARAAAHLVSDEALKDPAARPPPPHPRFEMKETLSTRAAAQAALPLHPTTTTTSTTSPATTAAGGQCAPMLKPWAAARQSAGLASGTSPLPKHPGLDRKCKVEFKVAAVIGAWTSVSGRTVSLLGTGEHLDFYPQTAQTPQVFALGGEADERHW